ncbi:MAG: TetR family transcriptional regulator C-terminal domain-containing protein, partial [Clostridia bacterium]|nr:TetR family transcriptional regulator C-terminal domain-containing protein [Clostridia bacterium]
KETGLNRSTFYANFIDIYDLADQMKEQLETDFDAQFRNADSQNATQMFRHIYENQLFYKTYFKLGYTESHKAFVFDTKRAESDFQGKNISYHIEFFRNGLNAIIRMWLEGGCKETPEEMAEILKAEYRGRYEKTDAKASVFSYRLPI